MTHKEIVLYAVRHGETALNKAGYFRGNKDVPLNEDGIRDAHKLAFYFAPIDILGIVSSDKNRAMTTARIISQQKNDQEPIPTESLRAFNVGEFSGKPRDEENTEALKHYIDNPDCTIPGGESLNDFRDRVQPAIREAIHMACESGLPLLLVGHSSIIHEIGNMFEKDHTAVLVEPGGAAAVYISGGEIHAEPIFKPLPESEKKEKADTIS